MADAQPAADPGTGYADRQSGLFTDDWPPSVLYVAYVLREKGAATQQDLIKETGLHKRTCRDALARLEDAGHIDREPNLDDLRQDYFILRPEGRDADE